MSDIFAEAIGRLAGGRVLELAIVLDQTAFYPTSGGQPFDQGALGGIPVVDVVIHENDSRVLHILQEPLQEQQVEVLGEID